MKWLCLVAIIACGGCFTPISKREVVHINEPTIPLQPYIDYGYVFFSRTTYRYYLEFPPRGGIVEQTNKNKPNK